MYCVVLLSVLAGSGQHAALWPGGYGGGVYAHGYGLARPITNGCCGVVLPPTWPADPTPWVEKKIWFDYVELLDGYERDEMIDVWFKATPEGRKVLIAKLHEVRIQAEIYKAKVEAERAKAREKEENRPLADEELQVWRTYRDRLKAEPKQDALAKWKKLSNRERRIWLRDIQKKMEDGED